MSERETQCGVYDAVATSGGSMGNTIGRVPRKGHACQAKGCLHAHKQVGPGAHLPMKGHPHKK